MRIPFLKSWAGVVMVMMAKVQGTTSPTAAPTNSPSKTPSVAPTISYTPTTTPSKKHPTYRPSTANPTNSANPTTSPTKKPSMEPSKPTPPTPSFIPTTKPTSEPSASLSPSLSPSIPPYIIVNSQLSAATVASVHGDYETVYPLNFGEQVFSAIILVLCAGISSHLCFGFSTRQSRETFIGLIFLIMIGYQFFHLIRAALFIPATPFTIFNQHLHRSDCLNSGKGGKRPFKSTDNLYKNPCFCSGKNAVCTLRQTSQVIPATTCPADGTATCHVRSNGKTIYIKPYISHFRNCIGGQGSSCTYQQPCFPCERDGLSHWGSIARCRACASSSLTDCTFIPGKGPYCYDKVGSKNVIPCQTCCTDPTPLYVNGTCY